MSEKWFKTFKIGDTPVLVTKENDPDSKPCVFIEFYMNNKKEFFVLRGDDEERRDYAFEIVNKKFCQSLIENLILEPDNPLAPVEL